MALAVKPIEKIVVVETTKIVQASKPKIVKHKKYSYIF
jgi:hypothetical protein